MQPSSPRERQIQSSADSGALDCRLADFRFRGKLGHGAYGIVYRAQAMTDNTPVPRGGVVAMKIVVNQFCRTSAVSHRFAHEYGLLRLIDPHPNINRYYGQWQERPSDEMVRLWPDFFREEAQVDVGGTLRNRTAQIVLLRYHNLSLAKYMKDVRGCLPEATFIRLAGGALAGLAHLASYHIAHLDVKPNNVMVDTTDPRRPTLVFIDFGCAQQFVGWRLPSVAKLEGNSVFRAPEVLSAYQQLPGTSPAYVDVDYSKQPSFEAGVLLYWLATRADALPDYPVRYNNTHSHKIQYAVDTDVDWSRFPTAFPPWTRDIIRGLLECKPERRMRVEDALAQWRQHSGVQDFGGEDWDMTMNSEFLDESDLKDPPEVSLRIKLLAIVVLVMGFVGFDVFLTMQSIASPRSQYMFVLAFAYYSIPFYVPCGLAMMGKRMFPALRVLLWNRKTALMGFLWSVNYIVSLVVTPPHVSTGEALLANQLQSVAVWAVNWGMFGLDVRLWKHLCALVAFLGAIFGLFSLQHPFAIESKNSTVTRRATLDAMLFVSIFSNLCVVVTEAMLVRYWPCQVADPEAYSLLSQPERRTHNRELNITKFEFALLINFASNLWSAFYWLLFCWVPALTYEGNPFTQDFVSVGNLYFMLMSLCLFVLTYCVNVLIIAESSLYPQVVMQAGQFFATLILSREEMGVYRVPATPAQLGMAGVASAAAVLYACSRDGRNEGRIMASPFTPSTRVDALLL